MNDIIIPKAVELSEIGVMTMAIRGLVANSKLDNVKIHDGKNSPYVINQGEAQDFPLNNFISDLGTVVYSNVIFNAGKVLDSNYNQLNTWDDFRIDDCLIQITQQKKNNCNRYTRKR